MGSSTPRIPDRAIVDLLFFPTGGGKTEAYLGLAAFAIARRRLNDPGLGRGGPLGRHALHAAASDARSASARRRPHLRARTRAKDAAGTARDLADRDRPLGRRRRDAQQSRQRKEPERKHSRLLAETSTARGAGRRRRRSKRAPGAAPTSRRTAFGCHPTAATPQRLDIHCESVGDCRLLRARSACRSSPSTRRSIAACRRS